jgi:hypothetical protein
VVYVKLIFSVFLKEMEKYVLKFKKTHPGEDHGSVTRGHYSVMCMQNALRAKGYNLIFLNRMPTFAKHSRSIWFERLETTSFKHVIIIGIPAKQKKGISHCIARYVLRGKPELMCPDVGEWNKCEEGTLHGYFDEIQGAYAILTHAELQELKDSKRTKVLAAGVEFE